MDRHRRGRWPFRVVLVTAVLMALVLSSVPGDAGSFKAKVSQYDYLSYEVDVDTLHSRLTFTCNAYLEILVYDPDGKAVEVNGTSGFEIDFVPARKGQYTILLLSDMYPEQVQGECNFDMRETSTDFDTTIGEGEWLDYEIEVEDNNRPIAVHIEFEGTYDRIYPVLVAPSGSEVEPRMDGSVNHSYYVYPARTKGTYKLSIEGSRVLMPEGRHFEASCNYPITGPGIPMTILGMSPTTLIILVVLAVVAAVSLLVARWQVRRRRERASRWRPVTDISGFEPPPRASLPAQVDYSYLDVHGRRGRRRMRRPPPEPPPSRETVVRYAPDTIIIHQAPPPATVPAPVHAPPPATAPAPVQAPPPAAAPPSARGTDGYVLPPPPPAVVPAAAPPVEPGPAPAAAPQASPDPEMRWPRCSRCGNILMANHPVCARCGAPRQR
jgi:hypothetical protein